MSKIVALVVTYNRKVLLEECLNALCSQSIELNTIIIIDNNSNDGTDKLINSKFNKKNIVYRKLDENLGGAGGFYEGIKFINENLDYDWLWLMDDDTIPYTNTLESTLKYMQSDKENVSFYASCVFGPDHEPMNVPEIDDRPSKNGYANWYFNLNKSCVKIKSATFVSLFISKEGIDKVGYPNKEYFIWGDDTEYTLRLTSKYAPAYLLGESRVVHKRYGAKSLSLTNEEKKDRIDMYKFFYRNTLLNSSKYNGKKIPLNYF